MNLPLPIGYKNMKNYRSSRKYTIIAFINLIFFSAPSIAAPLCLSIQPGISPQCVYYDISQCINDAGRMGASCTINRDFVQHHMSSLFVGSGQFCFTDVSTFASCIYQTQEECAEAISDTNKGVCVNKDSANGSLTYAKKERAKEKSILSGVDSLGGAPSVSPTDPLFDPLEPFNTNINNKGSDLDFNLNP